MITYEGRYVLDLKQVIDMMHIIYKDEGRNVNLIVINTNKGEAIIEATETVTYEGVTKTATRVVSNEEIEELLHIFFARAGFENVNVEHYGAEGTIVKDAIFKNLVHTVKPGEENKYVVTPWTKSDVKF